MKTALWGGALALALFTMSACDAYAVDDGSVIEVANEPPPPQVEVQPPVPYYGAVWVGGGWEWRDGRHVWVRGRYVRPRAGYVYEPHRWDRAGVRWRHTPGRWRRR